MGVTIGPIVAQFFCDQAPQGVDRLESFPQLHTNNNPWMRQMMPLAFALLISATVALIVNATAFWVKLWLTG